MSRSIPLMLLLTLLACSLFLVNMQSRARHLFIEIERSQARIRQAEVDWSQLRLDQSTLGKHERMDAIARKDLGMAPLTSNRIQYITLGEK
jgi:cell division protein FtsL